MADGMPTGRSDWISLSKLDRYRTCRRNAWYHYVVKARQPTTSANLVYGSAVHKAIEAHLVEGADPVDTFLAEWDSAVENTAIQYSQAMGPEALRACGQVVLRRFAETFWPESGLTVAHDATGRPLVEVDLGASLGDNVTLWGKIDLLAFNQDGNLLILDFKTPASPCPAVFPMVADQLTDYQVLVEANEETLNVGPVDAMGYVELLKRAIPKTSRGTGPTVHLSALAPRRTPAQLNAWISKVKAEVRDMRAGRYPRDPGPAYRLACDGCEFAAHCIHGIEDGLIVPEENRELLKAGPQCD